MSLQKDPMLGDKNDQKKGTPVVTSQPVPTVPLQDHPTSLKCPNCHQEVVTHIKYRNGLLTYVACTTLCIFGCFCGCCLIPFCVKVCKDVDHKCPECDCHIGTYHTLQEKFVK
ncbi:unnamed protein product [Schistosoma turkestanicum]|nr:unnamed protein product [Schistosoma turkestanicum]